MVHLRKVNLWRRITRNTEFAVLMHDYEHPLGGELPYDLEVGQGMDLTFPIENEFIEEGFTHIGIADTFGRTTWCRRREMKEAKEAHMKKAEP